MTATTDRKQIGLIGVTFFVISAMIGFDGLAATAAVGPSVFGWWAVIVVLFLIPNLLMVSELGTAFPSEGAVYDWAHMALGPKHAARVGWYYWINVPFWMPAVYLIASGILTRLFMPEAGTWVLIGMSIGMVWLTVLICNAPAHFGSLINILGGSSKIVVLLALGLGGILYVRTHGSATELNFEAILPRFDEGFRYAPTLVYLIVGAETVACMGGILRKPKRDIPLGLFIALAVILVFYSLAIAAMMVAIPSNDLSLVAGITQSFEVLFGDSTAGRAMTVAMSIVALVALVTYIVPWLMASSRTAAEGAELGEMPKVFAKRNAHGSPVGANILTGLTATGALLLYGLMAGSADELFWALFAFASFLLFVTYFFLLAAFIRLRSTHADAPRPFGIPGGKPVAYMLAASQALVLGVSCIVFIFPDIMSGHIDLADSLPIIIGIIAAGILIEFSVRNVSSVHADANTSGTDAVPTQ